MMITERHDPKQQFVIRFEEREQYLYASVRGELDDADVSRRYWAMIADYCRERNFERVLVVESFTTSSSLIDVYLVASEIPRLMKGVRIAFVDEQADHFEENVFGETVAVNRGASGRVFRNEDDAVRWLTS